MKNIPVDFLKTDGIVKPMHGVNNGPIGSAVTKTGNITAFAEAHIPFVRTHDSAYCYNYGGEYSIDVHRIFRNFDADENDPASYEFRPTDEYIKKIEAVGARPFYRLGASIEHGIMKDGTTPPKDVLKWARVCEHIIRHYTEGWASGMHADIEYWEIWNEPDNCGAGIPNSCWQGTFSEFIDFYCAVASYLKKCFPHLKIGGPAFTWAVKTVQHDFMAAIRDRQVPLDFYSFHCYARDPEVMRACIADAKSLVDAHGYGGAELILNEWNYNCGWQGEDFMRGVRTIISQKGAAYTAACMCVGQESALDILCYYDARPCAYNGLFAAYTYDLLPGYYPFKFFSVLSALGKYVPVSDLPRGVYAAAATDGEKHAVMLARFLDDGEMGESAEPIVLSLGLMKEKKYAASVQTVQNNACGERRPLAIDGEGSALLSLPMYSVALIEIKEI